MISDKQLTANKKNAQLGGIKTTQGKEVSKYNALSHGLLRKTLTEYEKEAFLMGLPPIKKKKAETKI